MTRGEYERLRIKRDWQRSDHPLGPPRERKLPPVVGTLPPVRRFEEADLVRCPSCNPINGGNGLMRNGAGSSKYQKETCTMCKGTKQVTLAVAQAYTRLRNETIDSMQSDSGNILVLRTKRKAS